MFIKPPASGPAAPSWGAATAAAPLGTVEDARQKISAALKTWVQSISDHAIALDQHPDDPPAAPVFAVSVTTGVGKSYQAQRAAVDLVRHIRSLGVQKRSVVLAVPRHVLADEFSGAIATLAHGLTVQVYRGREAMDPQALGHCMCRRAPEAKALEFAGGSVERTLCQLDEMKCQFFDTCGTRRQKREFADIWIMPHAMLWRMVPKMIDPVALIVDEDPSQGAFGGFDGVPRRLSQSDMLSPLSLRREIDMSQEKSVDLSDVTARLGRAIFYGLDGRVQVKAITDAGLSSDDLREARKMVWGAVRIPDIGPLTNAETIHHKLELVIPGNRVALNLARLLNVLIEALEDGLEFAPGLFTETVSAPTGEKYRAIRIRWLNCVAAGWNVPTIITSATARPEVLRKIWPALGDLVEAEAAQPHVTVRQITDRAFGASSITPSDRAPETSHRYAGNTRARLLRYMEARSAELGGKMLVIGQEALIEKLRAEGLPAEIETVHFNGLSGSDIWRDARCVVVIGRTQPPPSDVEHRAEVLAQAAPDRVDGWYPLAPGYLDMRGSGEGPAVSRPGRGKGQPGTFGTERHPDRLAEAIRWGICEGELMQAIGRGRGVNRTGDTLLAVDILTAIPLPIAVDEAGPFEAFEPTAMDLMAARGVMVSNRQAKGAWHVVAAVLPDLYRTAEAARDAGKERSRGGNPISIYIGISPRERDMSPWGIPTSVLIREIYRQSATAQLKLAGARYAVPIVVRAASEAEARDLTSRMMPGCVLTEFKPS